jgi:hypothetical protein
VREEWAPVGPLPCRPDQYIHLHDPATTPYTQGGPRVLYTDSGLSQNFQKFGNSSLSNVTFCISTCGKIFREKKIIKKEHNSLNKERIITNAEFKNALKLQKEIFYSKCELIIFQVGVTGVKKSEGKRSLSLSDS